ncbi:MAG: general secretion pathway protein GspD [Planctomycetes bacterium]|nr:general secretion pathway protein GspD [Planctomycetota bacterium]
MKVTTKLIISSMFLAASLLVVSPASAAPGGATWLSVGTASVGQFSSKSSDSQQKSEVADLLKQARAAMKRKDFATADRIIARAESFRIKYSSFRLIGDTPTKARRDLQKLQTESRGGSGGSGSTAQRFMSALPSFGRKKDGRPTDLFADRPRTGNDTTAPNNSADLARRYATGNTTGAKQSPSGPSRLPLTRGGESFAARTQFLSPSDGRGASAEPYRLADKAAPTSHPSAARYANINPGFPRTEPQGDRWRTAPPLLTNSARRGAQRSSLTDTKTRATGLLVQARRAIAAGDLPSAERLAMQADRLGVPDSAYRRNEDRPSDVLWDLQQARKAQNHASRIQLAGGASRPKDQNSPYPDTRALYDLNNDPTHIMRVGGQDSKGPTRLPHPGSGSARDLFERGTRALKDHKADEALALSKAAWARRSELDDITRERLQERLQMLSVSRGSDRPGRLGSNIDLANNAQKVLFTKLQNQLGRSQAEANRLRQRNSRRAIDILSEARANIQSSELAADARNFLLRHADIALADMQRYIERNRSDIELVSHNESIKAQVQRERAHVVEVQEEIAMLVDQFNTLVDEKRYSEALLVAKKLRAVAPENETVAHQVLRQAQFIYEFQRQLALRDDKAQGYLNQMYNVDKSAIGFDDNNPIQYVENWDELSNRRLRRRRDRGRRRSPQELEILQKLSQPVSVRFNKRPLGEVMDDLAALTEVNMYLDPQGLDQENVSVDTPVTINLRKDISLKSALMLILEPLHLSFVVRNEVLNITSERLRDGDVYVVIYDVGDLVMPIPNFTPGGVGLGGALRSAYASQAMYTRPAGATGAASAVAVSATPGGIAASGQVNPAILSQMHVPAGGAGFGGPAGGFGGGGPGGLGGASKPDFDALIDLIQQTIEPTSWDEVGGPGTIAGHDTNLSLVVSQTQEVHEQLADLLEQLRRLQDLQVTIEVRFITLNDDFFERIGIDFDFDIDDNVTGAISDDGGPSVTFGLNAQGLPTADLDISITQGSFGAAIPTFGGFNAGSAASFGFAILSDIEAFFFVQAAQGDTRTNIMQAPKVTLFNGQQAFVSDTTQMPFVISLIPVVGDFAAAHQPVIVVLSEGTFMTVQAVVSNDRRYVRLTIVPFFSKIGDVETFTFSSERVSTRTGGGQDADPDDPVVEDIIAATTVQLPAFSFVTVTTTVSVPDGGTVLLGGIKRLSEGRNELGVPMLNKIPYINRLFKNIGIGKSTQSLMMMVTPRIIIQEEEEEKLGIAAP